MNRNNPRKWYTLDNAAKIYPATGLARWSSNFRMSVTLKENIDSDILQQAIDDVIPRFPTFQLRLKAGMFWYYLDNDKEKTIVQQDVTYPMEKLGGKKQKGKLFRVRYYNNRIAIEVFHVVCDGTGLLSFLKTVTAQYLRLKHNINIDCTDGVLEILQKSSPSEMEDAFKSNASFKALKDRKESKAYHYSGTVLPLPQVAITTGNMSSTKVKQLAKSYNSTVTEFLTAVIIMAFNIAQQKSSKKVSLPIKVSVPINLRNFYKTNTLRNFSLFVNPGIEPKYGDYSLEEIVQEVHHFMKMNVKEKYLNAIMCKNLSSEANPIVRIVPLFVKNITMLIAFILYGESRYSTAFSNIGVIKVPEKMNDYIEKFDFLLGRQRYNNHCVTACCFKDVLSVSFTRKIMESEIEKNFYKILVELGIEVEIESNI